MRKGGAIRRMAVSLLFANMLLASGGTGAALAATQDYTLINSTGEGLAVMHISPSQQEAWQEDVLRKEVLEDQEQVVISVDREGSQCLFDLKVIFDDEDDSVSNWREVDLCQGSQITLQYNEETKTGTAIVK